ncbi:hypothetical protein LEMLEM_LOCUS16498 [Lemmus lemmus]
MVAHPFHPRKQRQSSWDPGPWDGAIHIQVGSFLLVKPLWKYPRRHSQRDVSITSVNCPFDRI